MIGNPWADRERKFCITAGFCSTLWGFFRPQRVCPEAVRMTWCLFRFLSKKMDTIIFDNLQSLSLKLITNQAWNTKNRFCPPKKLDLQHCWRSCHKNLNICTLRIKVTSNLLAIQMCEALPNSKQYPEWIVTMSSLALEEEGLAGLTLFDIYIAKTMQGYSILQTLYLITP